jgi:RNA polymerase sigma factor (sigma-70 family)
MPDYEVKRSRTASDYQMISFSVANESMSGINCVMALTPHELIPTRATLISRLRDWRDQSSWQDFFDTYWNLIYGVAIKGGLTPAEAEEAVQETIISVAKHMPTFKYDPAIGSFKAWLLNMTRWRITDQLRKRGPHVPFEESPDETGLVMEAAGSTEFENLWNREWERHLAAAAVTRVKQRADPKCYQIFDFYVNKEWEPERVAKCFGVPVAQVYLAKHRIMEMIIEEVDRLKKEIV